MKKILTAILLLSFCFKVPAQNRDNIWMLAYQWVVDDCGVNFNSGFADTFSVFKNLEFYYADAGISDTNGQLLFYTNAIYIANRNNDSLLNTENFNPGWATDFYGYGGSGLPQAVIIFPKPNSPTLYDVVHETADIADATNAQPLQLRLTEVDMTLDGGLGGVVPGKKNTYLIEDTLVIGRLTACKHANGRDWWVITHRWNSDEYYRVLVTPDTIYGPYEQEIGSVITKADQVGQACFSPDGSKYCMVNRNYNFDYMEFDRCTGEFSNAINIVLDSNTTQGCAFSPNSRFLYVNNFNQIYQYDAWAADFITSQILVDTIPFNQTGAADWFSMMQLAPDNKIYISTYNGTQVLHVIDDPDVLDTACHFIRDGLSLPSYNAPSIPNSPNYDLGPLIGSPCDTLFLSTPNTKSQTLNFSLSPNPSSIYVNIVYNVTQNATLTFTDAYGTVANQLTLYPYFKNRIIYTDDLAEGVYLVTLVEGEKGVSKKLVVVR